MRTVLYADKDVSELLARNFVLLWTSERPVPKVTIDFGDGRTLERTITGNAVHYILDAEGRPLDALPGLYAPRTFIENLQRSLTLVRSLNQAKTEDRGILLAGHHRSRVEVLATEFGDTAARVSPPVDASSVSRPVATEAIRIATGKMMIELPAAHRIAPPARHVRPDAEEFAAPGSEAFWQRIAEERGYRVRLDSRSLAVMARELPEFASAAPDDATLTRVSRAAAVPAKEAVALASTKSGRRGGGEAALLNRLEGGERDLSLMAATFLETLAVDTVRNEFLFHARIHQWFARGEVPGLETLNERVYAEIFLTPRSDPWLGLGAEGVYTGTSGGGRR